MKTTTKKTKAGSPEVEATPEGANEGVKAPGKVDVLDKAGNVIRTYSYEEHGPEFVELATSFAHKDSTRSLRG